MKSSKNKAPKKFCVIDIETTKGDRESALYGEPCYITYCDAESRDAIASRDLTGYFMQNILIPEKSGWIVYAHNGMGFDYKRLDFTRLVAHGFTGKIISDKNKNYKAIILEKEGNEWTLQDSFIKFPVALSRLLKITGASPKLDLNFEKEEFNPKNREHRNYALRDAVGLYEAIEILDKQMLARFGISFHAGATAPSLSMKAFKAFCKTKNSKIDTISRDDIEAICRESYFGGQTLALDCRKHEDVMALDIHKSYGAVMKNIPMPCGAPVRVLGHVSRDQIADHCLYHCLVHVREGQFPMLKHRHNERAGNYAGHFLQWIWGAEVKLAMDYGIGIRIIERIDWPSTTNILQQFIAGIAEDIQSKGTFADIGKLLQNSLYGKFSADKMDWELIIGGEATDPDVEMDGLEMVVNDIVHEEPAKPSFQKFSPHWGAYITAQARCALNRAILRKPEVILYCDTDSLFFERKYLPLFEDLIGPEYGQWGIEADKSGTFQAFAPKAYMIGTARKNKGIPQKRFTEILATMSEQNPELPENVILKYYEHLASVSYLGHNKLHRILSGGKGYGERTARRVANPQNATNGKFDKEGRWRPLVIDEREDGGDTEAENCSA
jgi:hypothetical protein